MIESTTEETTTNFALDHGVPSEKFGQHGYPDRIFFIPGGRPLLIEFKSRGKKPRPLQEHRINTLLNLGYDVEVHDDAAKAARSILAHLEAATLPKEGYEVSLGARLRRAVLEAGKKKDKHDPGCV